ncbi:MAG: hypothetical protein ACRDJI_01940 [Actinomycetota bacterium]
MGHQTSIQGSRAHGLPRASKKYPQGRVCLHPGCETRLSTYNRRDRCWVHAEMKIPRLRGRKPAPGSA